MSEQTTIVTIEKVTDKEGASNGKAWRKWSVKDGDGNWYSSFDAGTGSAARGLEGQRAQIVWKTSGDQGQFKDLISVAAVSAGADPGHEEFRAVTPTGGVDWDIKDLRINRCAFWKELLGPAMQAGLKAFTESRADLPFSAPELEAFVESYGAHLRMIAEADLYSDKQPANKESRLPF